MDRGAWWAAVHGVARNQTRLSDFTFTFHFHALEKEMATHSSVLAWRIPGMGEPGGLSSVGSHRIGHDWSDLAAAVCHREKAMAPHSSTLAWKIPWMEEPGRLQSMGSRRVGHDWAISLSLFTFMHWRRKWQPTLVFLPGGLPSMGSHRVGHDWSDLAAAEVCHRILYSLCLWESYSDISVLPSFFPSQLFSLSYWFSF